MVFSNRTCLSFNETWQLAYPVRTLTSSLIQLRSGSCELPVLFEDGYCVTGRQLAWCVFVQASVWDVDGTGMQFIDDPEVDLGIRKVWIQQQLMY